MGNQRSTILPELRRTWDEPHWSRCPRNGRYGLYWRRRELSCTSSHTNCPSLANLRTSHSTWRCRIQMNAMKLESQIERESEASEADWLAYPKKHFGFVPDEIIIFEQELSLLDLSFAQEFRVTFLNYQIGILDCASMMIIIHLSKMKKCWPSNNRTRKWKLQSCSGRKVFHS